MRTTLRDILGQQWHEFVSWMGAFGHHLQKPTQLLSNAEWARGMQRVLTEQQHLSLSAGDAVERWVDPESGVKKVTGNPVALAASQEYPVEYCKQVHRLWQTQFAMGSRPSLPGHQDVYDEDVPWDSWLANRAACDWPECRYEEVAEFTGVPTDFPL